MRSNSKIVAAAGLQIPQGAAAGLVATSDASGNVSWGAVPAGGGAAGTGKGYLASTQGPAGNAAETDLFRVTIPQGEPAAGDMYQMLASGDFLNNSGASVNQTFRVYLGTTVIAIPTISRATNANRGAWDMVAVMVIGGSTNQRIDARVFSGLATATAVSAINAATSYFGSVIAAEDTAAGPRDFALTVQLNSAAGTVDTRILQGYLTRTQQG